METFIFIFLLCFIVGVFYIAVKANKIMLGIQPPPYKPIRLVETQTLREDSPIHCPKCGGTQLHTDKKGFSVLKAAGGLLLIPGGVFWGLHGRNKIIITCLKCGKRWKV